MTPFQIWEKMVKAKVYSKEVATTRINTVYAAGQLSDENYTILIQLIESTYKNDSQ